MVKISVEATDGTPLDECCFAWETLTYGPKVTISYPQTADRPFHPVFNAGGFVTSTFPIATKSAQIAGGGATITGNSVTPPMPPYDWSFQFAGVKSNTTYTLTVTFTDTAGVPDTQTVTFTTSP